MDILDESSGESRSECDDMLSQHETPDAEDDQRYALKYIFWPRSLVETCFIMTKLLVWLIFNDYVAAGFFKTKHLSFTV